MTSIVSEGRQVKSGLGDPMAKLGKRKSSPPDVTCAMQRVDVQPSS